MTNMNEEDVYEIIKTELDKYMIFKPLNEDISRRIVLKIRAFVIEQKCHRRNLRFKRVLLYRVIAVGTGFLATFLWTGSWEAATGLSIIIEIVHSVMHYLMDKWIE